MNRLSKIKPSILIGLTGGPGVGKTEVAKMLAKQGVEIIFADKIGHDILNNNNAVKSKLRNLLGDEMFSPDGRPDRKKIGKLVFASPELLSAYNDIVHPLLLKTLKRELIIKTKKRGAKLVVVDAALIFEWGIANWFDILIVVDSTRQNRIKRLAKNRISQNQISQRIKSQLPQKDKIALADFVVKNNGQLLELKGRVALLLKSLKDAMPVSVKPKNRSRG